MTKPFLDRGWDEHWGGLEGMRGYFRNMGFWRDLIGRENDENSNKVGKGNRLIS